MRLSSAAAAAQAGGASMTAAEVVHAFKHAMAHSLGPAPPQSARPGSKRIAERRALAETSANVRAEAAPSPVKAPPERTGSLDGAANRFEFSDGIAPNPWHKCL